MHPKVICDGLSTEGGLEDTWRVNTYRYSRTLGGSSAGGVGGSMDNCVLMLMESSTQHGSLHNNDCDASLMASFHKLCGVIHDCQGGSQRWTQGNVGPEGWSAGGIWWPCVQDEHAEVMMSTQ